MARYYVLDHGYSDTAPLSPEHGLHRLTRANIGAFRGESVYRVASQAVVACGEVTNDGAVLVWGVGKVSV